MVKAESPDFTILLGTRSIGVEITECVSPAMARARKLAERAGLVAWYPLGPSLLEAEGATDQDILKAVRRGESFVGRQPEVIWARWIGRAIQKKEANYREKRRKHHDHEILLIYDNLGLPAVDHSRAIRILRSNRTKAMTSPFGRVLVLSGQFLMRIGPA